jgi:hypothetical protein
MTQFELRTILNTIRAGAEWTLRGETLADLEWHDQVQVKPTQNEIDAGYLVLQSLKYRDLRKEEYPPIGDGLDALVHKENGDPTQLAAYVAACNAVKEKYPKS